MSSAFPPDYVNVPVWVVTDTKVSPSIRDTYIQLRGLAWKTGYKRTDAYQIKDLAVLFGKTQSTIYEHVRTLRAKGWLQFSLSGGATYTFSFPEPEKPSSFSENSESTLLNEISDSSPEEVNQLIKKGASENSENLGRDERKRDPTLDFEAAVIYRRLVHITANPIQRDNMVLYVKDFPLWEATIKHWLGHGWSKMNVSGMIDSYKKGGEGGCTLCLRAKNGNGHKPANETAGTVDRVKALLEKRKNGNS